MKQTDIRAGVLYQAEGYPDPVPVVFLQDKASGVFEYLDEYDETDPTERPTGWQVRRLGKEDFFGGGRRQRSTDFRGSAAVTGPAEDLEGLDCEEELSRLEAGWPPSRVGLRWTLIGSLSAVKGPWHPDGTAPGPTSPHGPTGGLRSSRGRAARGISGAAGRREPIATDVATRPRGGTADYTHRTWKTEMIKAVTIFNAIVYVLDNMERSLAGMGGGETQLRWVRLCRTTAADIVTQTVQFVGVIVRRYDPVAGAVAAAGGQPEVVDDKRYYQTG